jgi:nickel-dependent lactate racemase
MKVELAYGQEHLAVDFPEGRTTVIEPAHTEGLADEQAAFYDALDHPVGLPALRKLVSKDDRVCIVFTDITRPTPNDRVIPWLLKYLSYVPDEHFILLNGLGTHRHNTPQELERLLTPAVARRYHVINHEAEKLDELAKVGVLPDGTPILLNRHLVEAGIRIITGFIEPHFFAGFSGGPKGIMPGCAGLKTVMSNHGAHNIGDPRAAFGITEGNPVWEEMRDIALKAGPSFLLNVALNAERKIAGVFAGDLIAAHKVGVEFVRKSAMQKVSAPFDVVVTTNSGYPLDLNLYQGVKGMSAGARILKPGGTLILAAECREGVPAGSPHEKLLREAVCPEQLLSRMQTPGFSHPEQWQSQIQALIQRRANVLLHSSIADDIVRKVHLTPCPDIGAEVRRLLDAAGPESRVAVLPVGPLTIPYIESGSHDRTAC